jgi:hypothetical protein
MGVGDRLTAQDLHDRVLTLLLLLLLLFLLSPSPPLYAFFLSRGCLVGPTISLSASSLVVVVGATIVRRESS